MVLRAFLILLAAGCAHTPNASPIAVTHVATDVVSARDASDPTKAPLEAGKLFRIALHQNGRWVAIEKHVAHLKAAPFEFVFSKKGNDALLATAMATHAKALVQYAESGKPFFPGKYTGPEGAFCLGCRNTVGPDPGHDGHPLVVVDAASRVAKESSFLHQGHEPHIPHFVHGKIIDESENAAAKPDANGLITWSERITSFSDGEDSPRVSLMAPPLLDWNIVFVGKVEGVSLPTENEPFAENQRDWLTLVFDR